MRTSERLPRGFLSVAVPKSLDPRTPFGGVSKKLEVFNKAALLCFP